MIQILKACRREVGELPEEIRGDLADALARLDAGQTFRMPLSRPMPSIGSGVHGFKKTSRATPKRNIETARMRLKEIGK